MPTLNQVYEAFVRALRAETTTDPDPSTPEGPNARLASIAQVAADEHAAAERNRQLKYPSIEVSIASDTPLRGEQGMGIWRGRWSYDDAGHRIGRIFETDIRARFQCSVYAHALDDQHDVNDLDDDLRTVITRFNPNHRGAFLLDEDGTPMQNVDTLQNDGGGPRPGQRNRREYERDVVVEFTELTDEAEEYGPTPRIDRAITPIDGESHGWANAPVENGIRAQPDPERVEDILNNEISAVHELTTETIESGEEAIVSGTLAQDGTLIHDGTLSYRDSDQ